MPDITARGCFILREEFATCGTCIGNASRGGSALCYVVALEWVLTDWRAYILK